MTVRTVENDITGDRTKQGHYPGWQSTLMWVVVLALVAIAIGMRLYKLDVPFDRDSYDEGVYWASLRAMSAGYGLYSQIFYSQPPFFLLSTFPGYVLFGGSLESARLGIALVSLLGLPGAFLLGKALSGRVGAIAAMLLLIVNPLYLQQSQTIQAEASSVAFSLLAVGLAYLWWEHPEGIAGLFLAALAGVTLSLGVLCKLLSVAALVPMALLIVARLWQILFVNSQEVQERMVAARGRGKPPRHPASPPPPLQVSMPINQQYDAVGRKRSRINPASFAPILVGVGASVVTLLVVLLPFLGSYHNMVSDVITFHTDAARLLEGTPAGKALSPVGNGELIRQGLSTMLALTALYGTVVALLRRDWRVLPLIAWLLATVYFLSRLFPLFPHHMVALVPPLIGLAVMGIASPLRLPSLSVNKDFLANVIKCASVIAVLLILVTAVFALRQDRQYYGVAIAASSDNLAKQEAMIAADLRGDQFVITDAQFIADLAGRNTPPFLVDTSSVRIETGYLTLSQLVNAASQPQVHAILFFSGRFGSPNVASFHDWVRHHFHLLHSYGHGRELWIR